MSKPFYLKIILSALLTVIICFFGIVFPLLTSFLWAWPIALLTAREGVRPGLLAAVLSMVLLALLIAPQWAAASALQFGSLGLVLGYCFSRVNSFKQILLKAAAVSLVVTLLVFLVPHWGANASADIAREMSGNIDNLVAMWEDMGLAESLNQQDTTIEELKSVLDTAVHWFIRLLPSLLVISALGSAFFNFLASRWSLKKKGYPLAEFPAFIKWWVPWYTSWTAVIGLGLALLGDYVNISSILTVGLNLIVLHLPLAFIIGLSVGVYMFSRIKSTLFQAAVIFAGFFYLPVTVLLVLLVGVFDPLFDFRKIHFKSV